MPKSRSSSIKAVREPAQVYLARDDSELLARLAADTGLSKAEILRRGIRSFAREQGAATSPMLAFIAAASEAVWPEGIAVDHDAVLAESYQPAAKKRR